MLKEGDNRLGGVWEVPYRDLGSGVGPSMGFIRKGGG